MSNRAFAVAAHPDDIEFLMAGTLVLLKNAGFEIHCMTVANGSCGSARLDAEEIIKIRREEAMAAAASVGAVFHESLVNDIEIFYEKGLLARLGSIMRDVAPQILLVHSPRDYMADHENAARLAVTAAFCRGMRNFPVDPPRDPVNQQMTVYHAQPYGNRDPVGQLVTPEIFVDVSTVLEQKRRMLSCHQSQKAWLDESQGIDSYLNTMTALAREVGTMAGRCQYAEGWRKHLPFGFCEEHADPLCAALTDHTFR